jgi:hypothetical protein
MPVVRDESSAITTIAAWTGAALEAVEKAPDSYWVPPLATVTGALRGDAFMEVEIGERDDRNRELVRLKVGEADGGVGSVDRFMLPIHAVLSRALELAGSKIELITGGGIEKAYFDFKVGKIQTNLHRLLFGVPSTGRLWERKEKPNAYRYIIPSHYKPGPGVTRERVILEISRKLSRRKIPNPVAIISLLRILFFISDHWHWNDLEDRFPWSDSERYDLRSLDRDFLKLLQQ